MRAQFTYVGIRVKDLKKSVEFYTKLLGIKIKGRGKIDRTKGETVGLESEEGGFVLELNYYERDSPYHDEYIVGEGLDHLAFKVEDLTKALEEARSFGHNPVLESKTDGGHWAYIRDPNEIWIELF